MHGFKKRLNQRRLMVGVGSALVDILIHENDAFLKEAGGVKGGMILVDQDFIDPVVARAAAVPTQVPGGSACNTMVGIGRLGGRARFVGKCGHDALGRLFETSLHQHHVDPMLLKSSSPTGRVLSVITPDAQRSMFTFLGASAEMQPEDITPAQFENAAIVHIEGYLLFNQKLMRAALEAAKIAGALISLDLASYTVIEAAPAFVNQIIDHYVDILIGNEDEARVLTGYADEAHALDAMAERATMAILKLGSRGSAVEYDRQRLAISPMGTGNALDTTGAGDLWAAGFLYGLVEGFTLEDCGRLASACGYEVCQVVGANIPNEGWQRIHRLMEE
jgi:sugar/nucleoside kinase (ribokinase family)